MTSRKNPAAVYNVNKQFTKFTAKYIIPRKKQTNKDCLKQMTNK